MSGPPTHLFVATPMYGGLCDGLFAQSLCTLVALWKDRGEPLTLRFILDDALISRARNDLAHQFLASGASHLLFIDADIEFNAADVPRLLDCDEPLVGATYPRKSIDYERVCQGIVAGAPLEDLPRWASSMAFDPLPGSSPALSAGLDAKGLKEVAAVGTGFLLIRREVFETLAAQVPRYINNTQFVGEETYDFFAPAIHPQSRFLLAEDYQFCQLWRGAGGRILVAPWVMLRHSGRHRFG